MRSLLTLKPRALVIKIFFVMTSCGGCYYQIVVCKCRGKKRNVITLNGTFLSYLLVISIATEHLL